MPKILNIVSMKETESLLSVVCGQCGSELNICSICGEGIEEDRAIWCCLESDKSIHTHYHMCCMDFQGRAKIKKV